MTVEPNRMVVPDLARCCAEETDRFFRRQAVDTRFCYELFRRALAERDGRAWDALYQQYRPLVAGWIRGHPEFLRIGGEVEEYVNRTFERIWAAVSPAKFERFRELNAVLAYLKMCAHSAIIEEARKAGPLGRTVALEELSEDVALTTQQQANRPVEEATSLKELKDELWETVNARLQNDKERLVVRGLFELNLKPNVIFSRYPGTFRDVHEVYVIRQIVLERLRRDPDLRALAGQDA